jgi:hypothetical protein
MRQGICMLFGMPNEFLFAVKSGDDGCYCLLRAAAFARGTTLAISPPGRLPKGRRPALFGRYSLEKGGIFGEGRTLDGTGAADCRGWIVV